MNNLKGNTILITGAATGMGLSAAKWFSEQGNKVILVARNEERLKKVTSELSNASYIVCDLNQFEQLESLVEKVKEYYQDLNMVFLNAGTATNFQLLGAKNAYEISKTEMVVNFHSAVYLTHELIPLIENKEESAFIITTSGVVFGPDLTHPTYSASKAALHNYILGLRLELYRQKSNIELYELIAPLVDTPFSSSVESHLKVSADEVIKDLIVALKEKDLEVRPGLTEIVYKTYLSSPHEALLMINGANNI
ncbi:SDR family NAD(P)-dependent oxidoreductase [Sphingobacterium rhinopitheci]|uniref:SDR family NAD(P)-dependent oxidoreductase n=1 Tax=Sphingobacterium rhinopitheci TaxID=2781960 RepID=UPI001F51E152|nr:SDR family NAD(P)-dependent oxidoreductase [Sphingobacterium rhinopitheci]MCI0922537.1 SDR family NAD(P)-dependent oxidoreductase [Sphingobacterium rhinopitheci]